MSEWRCIVVDATWWRRIDVNMTVISTSCACLVCQGSTKEDIKIVSFRNIDEKGTVAMFFKQMKILEVL